jgi:3-hexulose-6-phosphate synthase
MKLQVALDGNLNDSLAILEAIAGIIDIAEIGTPLIYREGMNVARIFRQRFPTLMLLADLKIMDAGEEEATIAFEAGCDLVTVMGVTQDSTIRGAVNAARHFGKQIVADLMEVSDPVTRGRELLNLGCDYLCVHTAYDMQSAGHSPLETLEILSQQIEQAKLAVAGGIKLSTIDAIVELQPEILIVGGAITRAPSPVEAVLALRERMR